MTHLTAPAQPLTDGTLTLRLPSPAAGDIDTVRGYIDQDQLNDAWLPGIPLIPAGQAISDWRNGWAGRTSRDGPVLVVTIPEEPRFIGIIALGDRGEGIIEMVYGIAPRWRGRGLASRATRLAARWALSQPGVTTVELRIDQDHTASQHVAENAGFTRAGTITQYVPGAGQTFEDLRYVLERQRCRGRLTCSIARNLSSARALWLFTLPGEQPSMSATWSTPDEPGVFCVRAALRRGGRDENDRESAGVWLWEAAVAGGRCRGAGRLRSCRGGSVCCAGGFVLGSGLD